MRRYKLQILVIQETKINEDGNIDIETTDGKYKYDLMHVGSKHHGVGIVADKDIKAEYKIISDRICTATFKTEQRTAIFVSTYAPTLEQTQKNPQNTEKFYEDLKGIIDTTSRRHSLTIAGDLNAKTGTGHTDYPDNIKIWKRRDQKKWTIPSRDATQNRYVPNKNYFQAQNVA